MSAPRSRARGDCGSTVVELAVVLPLMILLLMMVIEAGIYFHTRAVVVTAARHGLDSARAENGSTVDGTASTNQFLDQAAGGLRTRSVQVTRTATDATVTVSGDVVSVLPLVPFTVDVTVTAPVERILP